jgi:hypothetical protein
MSNLLHFLGGDVPEQFCILDLLCGDKTGIYFLPGCDIQCFVFLGADSAFSVSLLLLVKGDESALYIPNR